MVFETFLVCVSTNVNFFLCLQGDAGKQVSKGYLMESACKQIFSQQVNKNFLNTSFAAVLIVRFIVKMFHKKETCWVIQAECG